VDWRWSRHRRLSGASASGTGRLGGDSATATATASASLSLSGTVTGTVTGASAAAGDSTRRRRRALTGTCYSESLGTHRKHGAEMIHLDAPPGLKIFQPEHPSQLEGWQWDSMLQYSTTTTSLSTSSLTLAVALGKRRRRATGSLSPCQPQLKLHFIVERRLELTLPLTGTGRLRPRSPETLDGSLPVSAVMRSLSSRGTHTQKRWSTHWQACSHPARCVSLAGLKFCVQVPGPSAGARAAPAPTALGAVAASLSQVLFI